MPMQEPAGDKIESARSKAKLRAYSLAALGLAAVVGLLAIASWRNPGDGKSVFGAEDEGNKDKASALDDVEASSTLSEAEAAKKKEEALAPFRQWGKPDFVLVLSGQQHGYLQPCGCSHPQLGGLVRRYNLVKILEKRGWNVSSLDLGDIAQATGFQPMLKYATSMKALKLIGTAAVGIGANEMALPLINALGEYALNNPSPRVLMANLIGIGKDGPFEGMVAPWQIISINGQTVGVISVVGPSVMTEVKDPDVKVQPVPKVLPGALKEIGKKKPDFLVLLYQGSEKEATACAGALKDKFHVIVHLSADSEPRGVLVQVGKTALINTGHKGRYVGVLGAFRNGTTYTFKYQLMALGEEFETAKKSEKKHPVMKLMEDYALDVKNKGYLAQAAVRQASHPVQLAFPQSTYLGAEACKACHKNEYSIWKNSKKMSHHLTYTRLTKAKNPSNRQFDPECVRCHVTGWGFKTGFTDAISSKHLLNNGCESCHGPGSEHVAMEQAPNAGNKQDRVKIRNLMNPFRFDPQEKPAARKRRLNLIDQSCQQCHDVDNDVNWDRTKWNKIVHSGDHIGPND